MNYKGRYVDAVALWSNFVNFPSSMNPDHTFSPLVFCPNPQHENTRSPAFQINLQEPKVHCFSGCGLSGSYEHAICILEGLYEKHGVDLEKANKAWVKKPQDRSDDDRNEIRKQRRARREASKIIARTARGQLDTKPGRPLVARGRGSTSGSASVISTDSLCYQLYIPQLGLEYLEKRGITENSISRWQIGWDPEERRIVIPACDLDGKVQFLIKRAVRPADQPKYLYSEGAQKSSLLFGACEIQPGMVKSGGLVVVEGSLDCILLHQHGIKTAVAILGTGISTQQRKVVEKLRPAKIYNFFDRDLAGIRNIEIAAKALRKYPQFVVRYPKGKTDPAELTKEEALRQIERSVPLSRFFQTIPR